MYYHCDVFGLCCVAVVNLRSVKICCFSRGGLSTVFSLLFGFHTTNVYDLVCRLQHCAQITRDLIGCVGDCTQLNQSDGSRRRLENSVTTSSSTVNVLYMANSSIFFVSINTFCYYFVVNEVWNHNVQSFLKYI